MFKSSNHIKPFEDFACALPTIDLESRFSERK
jgi:hypothetical protein